MGTGSNILPEPDKLLLQIFKKFSVLPRPFYDLLKRKGFSKKKTFIIGLYCSGKGSEMMSTGFHEKIENGLSNFDIICFPYAGAENEVMTNACVYGVGEVVLQLGGESFLRPVALKSTQYNLAELT